MQNIEVIESTRKNGVVTILCFPLHPQFQQCIKQSVPSISCVDNKRTADKCEPETASLTFEIQHCLTFSEPVTNCLC